MILLDLFCGAGGASKGYVEAGFEVFGVDNKKSRLKAYPYESFQGDALEFLVKHGHEFDAIHASPPCQAYGDAQRQTKATHHPRLIEPVRRLLMASEKPYVIENVDTAPLIDPILLCGTMFPGLRVIRHRLFESNVLIAQPNHIKKTEHPLCHTTDKRKPHYRKTDEWKNFVMVNGGGNCSLASAQDAMDIDWMSKRQINEAIPPAYTTYVGRFLYNYLHEKL
jgi:DNA (cytosine-5)-methyltransferase 1